MLTKIQIQEKAKRKRNRRRGLQQPPGTRPYEYKPVAEPVFKPIPFPRLDLLSFLKDMNERWKPPWLRKSERERKQ